MSVSVRINSVVPTRPPSRSEREKRLAAHVEVEIVGLGIEPLKTKVWVSFDSKEEMPAAVLGRLETFAQELIETVGRHRRGPWMG